MADERFVKIYSQGLGTLYGTEIWIDKETGVNYVFHFQDAAGGLTPLLDKDGKPVVTSIENKQGELNNVQYTNVK